MEAGYFPDTWKTARITPVFKQGDPTSFSNYRPISVLPVFSKVFEKIIQNRLLSFLQKQASFLKTQYGFRHSHSTYMAIMNMVESVREAWEKNEYCLGIFVDFKKAFDTVDFSILFSKLENLGIRGLPLALIKSYFRNRRQFVVYRGSESSLWDILVGVPQGSILGPLFFLIYINDLSRISNLFQCILFADDTNLFISNKTRISLYKEANNELEKFSLWVAHNRLTLNLGKTEFIEFSKSVSLGSDQSLRINGRCISKVEESKFLGIYLDSKLSWRSHITKVITKISQTIGILGRARSFMGDEQLALLYNTMVLPHLQYCLINWGNFKGDSNSAFGVKILSLQKCLVRLVGGAHRLSHADPLFFSRSFLKIDDLYAQSVRMFSYKLSKKMLPDGVSSLFQQVPHQHNTRSAKTNLFMQRCNQRSIKYIAPKCWNSLPASLKEAPSIGCFKTQSKKSLLAPYASFSCKIKHCPSCTAQP